MNTVQYSIYAVQMTKYSAPDCIFHPSYIMHILHTHTQHILYKDMILRIALLNKSGHSSHKG